MKLNLILATTYELGIGMKNGALPWSSRKDMRRFSKLTKGKGDYRNLILMGRNTWEGLPKKPLPQRDHVILSRRFSHIQSDKDKEHVFTEQSMKHILETVMKYSYYDEIWIIGGKQVYEEFIKMYSKKYPHCIYWTWVVRKDNKVIPCEISLSNEIAKELDKNYTMIEKEIEEDNELQLIHCIYKSK